MPSGKWGLVDLAKQLVRHEIRFGANGVLARVPATTINSFCEEHGIKRIDVPKIDTARHDVSALVGGQRMRTFSLVTNVSVLDDLRIRHVVSSWLRVFGSRLREIVITVDESPPSGHITALHDGSGSMEALFGRLMLEVPSPQCGETHPVRLGFAGIRHSPSLSCPPSARLRLATERDVNRARERFAQLRDDERRTEVAAARQRVRARRTAGSRWTVPPRPAIRTTTRSGRRLTAARGRH